jgi:hypothetical protein
MFGHFITQISTLKEKKSKSQSPSAELREPGTAAGH